ncbi:MarR family winged helix-turn-helix transcriptional regulator [Amycolatopsis cynarae]|uniref:MarR family winged helix-turn-helix transcriptional regulator n=1 Tax=Amycolatopsis cynarae TaxID=2995223 RepID=A0ABY7B5E4_9PSEU|nr:MarR family winged helix-turn-helix transcriptional regulator [Amycolatopsis sp. HUAS 11-8]WAL66639.1 MarR family winged helix-turn-helix transcriptional regulator [Amycolatopsis sp. HUAS 11-8]
MPSSDPELLEPLLTKVMRLAAVHGDAPAEVTPGVALTTTEGVLLVELLAIGEATQQQLADRLSLDKSRVSRLCLALERKKVITRERDERNRRNLVVRITELGEQAATRLRRTWRDHHERMLAAMSAEERNGLLLGLRAIIREFGTPHRHGDHHD